MGRSEGATNLTGRLPVWEGLLPHLKSNFWLGFGYRAFWDEARVEEFRDYTGGWQVPDSHNSYIEMVAQCRHHRRGAIPIGDVHCVCDSLRSRYAPSRYGGGVFRRNHCHALHRRIHRGDAF